MVTWVGLLSVIVTFPGNTHLINYGSLQVGSMEVVLLLSVQYLSLLPLGFHVFSLMYDVVHYGHSNLAINRGRSGSVVVCFTRDRGARVPASPASMRMAQW